MLKRPNLRALGAAFRSHPWLVSALGLFTALALYFAISLAGHALRWDGSGQEPIRPWMTVGYIGRSWDMDPRRIDEIAGLPKPVDRPLTLAEIAASRNVPVAQIIGEVEAAIATLKAERHRK